jgi:hypothetical protein
MGKNTVKDVLLDGGSNVNIIIEDLKKKLRLLIPKCVLYTLRMANQNSTKLVGLIRNLKIHIHSILYAITFIVMKNNILDARYSTLFDHP